jgi:hypothetical protein
MIAQATPQSSYVQWIGSTERERLIDHRNELVGLVNAYKTELQASLERWCNHRRGSANAMWQTIAAIRRGQSQIAVIDLQLELLDTP